MRKKIPTNTYRTSIKTNVKFFFGDGGLMRHWRALPRNAPPKTEYVGCVADVETLVLTL